VKYWDESQSATSLVPWMDSSMQLNIYAIKQHADAFVYVVHGGNTEGNVMQLLAQTVKWSRYMKACHVWCPSFCMLLLQMDFFDLTGADCSHSKLLSGIVLDDRGLLDFASKSELDGGTQLTALGTELCICLTAGQPSYCLISCTLCCLASGHSKQLGLQAGLREYETLPQTHAFYR